MIYFLSVLLGLVIGSFLNVVVYRTEKDKSFGGRSYCPKCKKPIPWYDNVPLLSFLILGGHCRFCHKKISWQYPIVEMLTALAFLGTAFLVTNNLINDWLGHYFSIVGLLSIFPKTNFVSSIDFFDSNLKFFELLFLWSTFSVFIAILVYDLKHMLIPDSFTFAGIVIAAFYNIVVDIFLIAGMVTPKNQGFILETASLTKSQQLTGILPINFSPLFGWSQEVFYSKIIHLKSFFPDSNFLTDAPISYTQRPLQFIISLLATTRTGSGLIAGLVIALLFFSIVYISKETWMGMGDVKLVFLLGFLLGIFKTAIALLLAFEIGAALGIILIVFGRAKMKTALPFGPFLIIGAILSLLII